MSESDTGADVQTPPDEIVSSKIRVLVIDDQQMVIEALRRMLADQDDIEFYDEVNPKKAVDRAAAVKATVILLDLVMPFMDGYQVLRAIKAHPQLRDIPVIVLSSKEDARLKAQAFVVGAADYLVKVPNKLELLARIRLHAVAYQRQQDGALSDAQALGALDRVTGVANRQAFDEALAKEWQTTRLQQQSLALLLCAIDAFEEWGDDPSRRDFCLRKIAAGLILNLGQPSELLARYAPDSFVLLLPETSQEGALLLAEACRTGIETLRLAAPGAPDRVITLSIGVAGLIPEEGADAETLVELSQRALLQAKSAGCNHAAVAPA